MELHASQIARLGLILVCRYQTHNSRRLEHWRRSNIVPRYLPYRFHGGYHTAGAICDVQLNQNSLQGKRTLIELTYSLSLSSFPSSLYLLLPDIAQERADETRTAHYIMVRREQHQVKENATSKALLDNVEPISG